MNLWLKHENHTPLGAFKVRGGLVYFEAMEDELKSAAGVVCATRGNHGQSIAFAAAKYGIPVCIVVPKGNSREKNLAMESLGARLVEHGDDFQAALEHAESLAEREGLVMVPSFDQRLVAGVGTYSIELMESVPDLEVLYVPIGLGSGICGALAARKALDRSIEIVGVVSSQALAYSKSFREKKAVESPVTTRIADGMACRRPVEQALNLILDGVDRVCEVTDDQVEQAMRDIYTCTHNVVEGAGAAAVAAVAQDREKLQGRITAAVLCGANVDAEVFARVLQGR